MSLFLNYANASTLTKQTSVGAYRKQAIGISPNPTALHNPTQIMRIARNHAVLGIICILLIFSGALMSQSTAPSEPKSGFDKAVEVIKKYEGLHKASHWPLVGYGHKVLPTDRFTRGKALSEKEADQLLRQDLSKLCKIYSSFGKDSLLLATLAYNIGIGNVAKSSVYKKLKAGDRDIESSYLSHCRYRGKVLSQLQRRRKEEFETLFDLEEPTVLLEKAIDSLAEPQLPVAAQHPTSQFL